MSSVMSGVRIVEVADHTFVPAASAVLADWGASVIKVEHVERGDAMRGLASSGLAGFESSVAVLFEHSNRGKQSIAIDLAQPLGLDILNRLVESADVFLTNKLPAVRRRLRIDVEDIRSHNPDVIYVRGSGFGVSGPDVDAGGYDLLGYWARAGSAYASKVPDSDSVPLPPGPMYGDNVGAIAIAGGIAAALFHRERTGEADIVDVSLLGMGMWAMAGAIACSVQTQEPWSYQPPNGEGTQRNPLTGIYETADGRHITLSMIQSFHYWPEACERLGIGELVGDPRFATYEDLSQNAADAAALIARAISSRSLAEWRERLTGMKGQWAVVQDTLEVVADPQSIANGYVQEVHTSDGRPYHLVTTPVQFNEQPAPIGRGPDFNEHAEAILVEQLGLDWDTVIDLKLKGVVA